MLATKTSNILNAVGTSQFTFDIVSLFLLNGIEIKVTVSGVIFKSIRKYKTSPPNICQEINLLQHQNVSTQKALAFGGFRRASHS